MSKKKKARKRKPPAKLKVKKTTAGFYAKLSRGLKAVTSGIVSGAKRVYSGIIRFHLFRGRARWTLLGGRLTGASPGEVQVYWQPLWFVALKACIAVVLAGLLYSQYSKLGDLLYEIVAFFKLDKIYNFTFPSRYDFHRIGRFILLGLIIYFGSGFTADLIASIFSMLGIDLKRNKAFYIHNYLIRRTIHQFEIGGVEAITIRSLFPLGLLGIATLCLSRRTGETISIRSLSRGKQAFRQLNRKEEQPAP